MEISEVPGAAERKAPEEDGARPEERLGETAPRRPGALGRRGAARDADLRGSDRHREVLPGTCDTRIGNGVETAEEYEDLVERPESTK